MTTAQAIKAYDKIREDRKNGKATIHDQINAVNAISRLVGGTAFTSGMDKF